MADVHAYAALVDLGRPDFIEIKGVTYWWVDGWYPVHTLCVCGTPKSCCKPTAPLPAAHMHCSGDSPANGGLTMEKNVPWHHEVVAFSQALCDARNGGVAGALLQPALLCSRAAQVTGVRTTCCTSTPAARASTLWCADPTVQRPPACAVPHARTVHAAYAQASTRWRASTRTRAAWCWRGRTGSGAMACGTRGSTTSGSTSWRPASSRSRARCRGRQGGQAHGLSHAGTGCCTCCTLAAC